MLAKWPGCISRRRFVVRGGFVAAAYVASGVFAKDQAFIAKAGKGAVSEKEGVSVAKRQITIERLTISSSSRKPFHEVLSAIDSRVGHPDMAAIRAEISNAKTYREVETIVNRAVGPSGFMEFARFDLGEVLRKAQGVKAPRVVRLVIGNPLVMKRMVEHVADAGSYAPVTILIDERSDGVHLSYDTMASFLAPYGSAEALRVARELDSKVEALLTAAAA